MRHINRLLAALLSLAIIVVCALVVIEVVADRFSHKPALVHWHSAYAWARRTTWKDGSVRTVCIALVVLGLLLLLVELKRAKVSRLAADPNRADGAGIDTAYTRRGVATAVRAAVTELDGVRRASVKVGRRKVTVDATAAARDKAAAQSLRDPIDTAARQQVEALQLKSVPSVSVNVEPRRR